MSTTKTLLDIKQSADLYLEEAILCATYNAVLPAPKVLGFAAMALSLACVVAVGEALVGRAKPSDEECIKAFCKEIKEFDWLLSPVSHTPSQPPADILYSVRNALVHALSLPNNVCLVPTPEIYYTTYSGRFEIGIVPSLFVTAVQETLEDLMKRQPHLKFDLLSTTKNRSPVKVDLPPASGSTPG